MPPVAVTSLELVVELGAKWDMNRTSAAPLSVVQLHAPHGLTAWVAMRLLCRAWMSCLPCTFITPSLWLGGA